MDIQPFKLFSWDSAFLPEMVQFIDKCSHNNACKSTIIVPNNRPKRYFTEIYRQKALQNKATILLPNILTMQELIVLMRSQCKPIVQNNISSLDRIALLYDCIQKIGQNNEQLARNFKDMNMDQFLPWGQRLANIFEDCFNQNVVAQNLLYMEGEVSEFASNILNVLENIQDEYILALTNNMWSTPAFDSYVIAQNLADNNVDNFDALPNPLRSAVQDKLLFIAGFSSLTEVESIIFHYFWHKGAYICLHTDIDTVYGQSQGQNRSQGMGHWACSEHKKLLKKWGAKADIIVSNKHLMPHIHYAQGYDLHSQINHVKSILCENVNEQENVLPTQENASLPSAAIVLCDNKQLIPLLHALPNKDINISMGYSLERNSLYDFIDAILSVHSNRKMNQGYYAVELQRIFSHPYLQMLELNSEASDNTNDNVGANNNNDEQNNLPNQGEQLRPLLQIMLQELNSKGERFSDPFALAKDALTNEALVKIKIQQGDMLVRLLHDIFQCIFEQFSSVQTLADLSKALLYLCNIFLQYGVNTWKSYPLDAEAIYKIVSELCPLLHNSILSQTPLKQETLYNILRLEIKQIRIPFMAEPITGLQVMGMLETRLLQFDRIFILDMTDDKIPGKPLQDQLLPDALRILLGLPDSRARDKVVAYNFFRLIASAKDVHLCWQNSVQGSQLLDNRKVRSRFIDQLIWEEEKAKGKLLVMGENHLQNLSFSVSPPQGERKSLLLNSEMQKRLQTLLQGRISASFLDDYIKCPLQFAFSRLMKIREPSQIVEGDNYALMGQVIHEAFENLYKIWQGSEVEKNDINLLSFNDALEDAFRHLNIKERIPYDSFLMLKTASLKCFEKYLENQPDKTFIYGLEQKLESILHHNGMNFNLWGKADRIDIRDKNVHIIDYKTGKVHIPEPYVWQDLEFWEKIGANKQDMLGQIYEYFKSIQLPFYIYLASLDAKILQKNTCGYDAVFVDLKESGCEKSLFFDVNDVDIISDAVKDNIPNLLKYIIFHISNSCEFTPKEDKHCAYCIYENLCLR